MIGRGRLAAAVVFIVSVFVTGPAYSSSVGGSTGTEIRYGVSQQKGFDTCNVPSTSVMQTWWDTSPYYDGVIYLGGANRASSCSFTNLTSSWVSATHTQGWSFYLTWVGRQAPDVCNARNYSTYISTNTTTAYNQGVAEADAALNAASNLGFTALNVYYFDIEAYDTTNTTCRNAVKSFVSGWVAEIHALGEKAGVYGSTCGTAMSDFASISNVPDSVWLAAWNSDPDVWGLSCVANNLWSGSKRLHQYRGGHNETWGGVTLNIDNDCANGLVTPHGHGWTDTACTVE